jgi:hypothetical protein
VAVTVYVLITLFAGALFPEETNDLDLSRDALARSFALPALWCLRGTVMVDEDRGFAIGNAWAEQRRIREMAEERRTIVVEIKITGGVM